MAIAGILQLILYRSASETSRELDDQSSGCSCYIRRWHIDVMNKKAAFIKYGSFSHINESVLNELTRNFPGYEFDVYDLMPDKYSGKIALALWHSLREYGKDIFSGKKSFIETYNRTRWFFYRNRKLILETLQDKDYRFTFQTQSLFDASIPGTPHFLYTDHTHLANLRYPGKKTSHLLGESWFEIEKRIYGNASLIFTMSTNITQSLVMDYECDPRKVRLVYSGANSKSHRNEKFDVSRYARKNILFVGIDWYRKGGPALVEAFRQVLEVHQDATLTIVGCNPKVDVPNCRVMGKISLEEVKEYYRQASVFCLPTLFEPFGIAFVEAMAHKLPIVGTRLGAIPDFVHEGQNGYLVEPNNPVELSEALIRMLNDPGRCKKFGEYGNKLYRRRYTWERTGSLIRDNIMQFIDLQVPVA